MENKFKREKLYTQMLENPEDLCELNSETLFLELNNKTNESKLKINDLTEFYNIFNTLAFFFVNIFNNILNFLLGFFVSILL